MFSCEFSKNFENIFFTEHLKHISAKSFPGELKVAGIIPAFKNKGPNNKAIYRPITLLPIISKIFQGVLFKQIEKFAN